MARASDGRRVGSTLIMLLQPEPVTLASFANTQGAIAQVTTKIYEGLIDYDEAFTPRPALAREWQIDASARSAIFKLQPGVRFHDGEPFSSADVRFTFMEVLKRVHPRGRSTFRDLQAVETPDDETAIFRFSAPMPYLLASLSSFESPILSRHLGGETSLDAYAAAERPIGTGPFRFVEWRRGEVVRLERNGHYWRRNKPGIDGIDVQFVTDPMSRVSLFREEKAHVGGMGTIPWVAAAELDRLPHLVIGPGGEEFLTPVLMLDFNTRRPPFDCPTMRRAVSEALCRQHIVDEVFCGRGRVMEGPFHSSWIGQGLISESMTEPGSELRAQRKGHLRSIETNTSVHGGHFEFTLDVIPYGEEWTQTAHIIERMLAPLNIDAKVRQEPFDRWLDRVYARSDFQATVNYVYLNADPALGIHRLYHSAGIVPGASFMNASGWSSPETDRLMDAARVESNPDTRATLYRHLHRCLIDAAPSAWLAQLKPLSYCNEHFEAVLLPPFGVYGSFAHARLKDSNETRPLKDLGYDAKRNTW